MAENLEKLKVAVEVNLRFNDKYGLQYFEPDAYNRISGIISLMRKNKEIDLRERHIIAEMYHHLYRNYYKIKDLENAEPRKIAQQFIGRKKIRLFIIKRDGNKCLKCKSDLKLQLDHIIPISKGGQNRLSNLQTLCNSCNSKKRDTYHDYRNNNLKKSY